MLAKGIDVACASGGTTDICTWTADGIKQFAGFYISSSNGGYATLYVAGVATFRVHLPYDGTDPFKELIDKPYVPNVGVIFTLKFYQDSGGATTASGALLGG